MISSAPARRAPRTAAFISSVKRSRHSPYASLPPVTCSQVWIPATPSMSPQIITRISSSRAHYARCATIMRHMPRPTSSSRFEHHTIATSVPLHYVEIPSEGRPLLLLHGIGMDWRVWQATSRRLSPTFHLYMLDLRGHGESGKPAHGYSLAHYAADIEDFIDELRLEPIVLIGSSLGGAIAASVEAPADLIIHRVLVDPPLTGGPV